MQLSAHGAGLTGELDLQCAHIHQAPRLFQPSLTYRWNSTQPLEVP